MNVNKFQNELINYARLSGAFEYAVKQLLADKNNAKLRCDMQTAYNALENIGYKTIEGIINMHPNDNDAQSVYEIANLDITYMRFIFQHI